MLLAPLLRRISVVVVLASGYVPGWAAKSTPSEPPAYNAFAARLAAVDRKTDKVVAVYALKEAGVESVERLQADSVTHVIYAFARICGEGQVPSDAKACERRADGEIVLSLADKTFNEAFLQLKTRSPRTKILLSVGGWSGSDPFFFVARDEKLRSRFCASVMDFLRTFRSFDGVDIDWEHPTNNGAANGQQLGSPLDGASYSDLLQDLRTNLNSIGKELGRTYLLTSAVNTTAALVRKIDYSRAARALDMLFMMTYDFYGSWTSVAGNHTAFYDGVLAGESLASATRTMRAAGFPANKLIAGVAMYGRGFDDVVASVSSARASYKAPFPQPEGSIAYRELAVQYLTCSGAGKAGYDNVFDQQTKSWGLWSNATRRFIGFDDPRAVLAKGEFVRKLGLGGLFAWELSQDNGDIVNAMNVGVGNRIRQTGPSGCSE